MARRSRQEMIAETRSRLIAAARRAFASKGFAEASMDDFTAEAGLTRGALYHHFGDKKGLLLAVLMQIDTEMGERLAVITNRSGDLWQGFLDENVAYIEMALDPEIQRIVLREAPAVLGHPSTWPNANACIGTISATIRRLQDTRRIIGVDPEAAARMIVGASTEAAQWIANSENPAIASNKAIPAFIAFLEGLLPKR